MMPESLFSALYFGKPPPNLTDIVERYVIYTSLFKEEAGK